MTEIADRYRRRAGHFAEVAGSVPEGAWENESPCEGWTARDVVRHVVDTSGMFLGFIERSLPVDLPSVDDDPAAAFAGARTAIQSCLDDPATAALEYDGLFGPTTFETSVDRFLGGDAVIHAWDLARATGGDDTIDPDEVRTAVAAFDDVDDSQLRQPGVFGAALDPPADADDQTTLLAFLGRKAW